MQQEIVSAEKIKPNPWNTNVVSPENERKLAASIARFGLFKPIVVREIGNGFEIIGGEHRYRAAIHAGLTDLPIFNLGQISDVQAKEISLADNARYGADDTAALAIMLEDIGNLDELNNFLPFSGDDLKELTSMTNIALDDLDLIDSEQETDVDPEAPETVARAPKTHTIMRFKVPVEDAERIAQIIGATQKRHGFTQSDDLTNAGDALVHLLISEQPLHDDEDEDQAAF